MDDNYKFALELQQLQKGFEQITRQSRIERMKRWGQENCERCDRPLETAFDSNGKNPIRICWRCEMEDQGEEHD